MPWKQKLVATICLAFVGGAAAAAGPLEGDKRIFLEAADGARVEIGQVRFLPDGDAASYDLRLKAGAFGDHFLSMRPFKCLEGPDKHWCHVPYPYAIRRQVSAADLTDLEYDLLFLWKGAGEYGINMWNGVYYRLAIEDGRISGALHEMDMDILSAPPAPGDLRPIAERDLHEADPEGHWLPRLVIE